MPTKDLERLAGESLSADLVASTDDCIQEGPQCNASKLLQEECIGQYSPTYLRLLKGFEERIDAKCDSLNSQKNFVSLNASAEMNQTGDAFFAGQNSSSIPDAAAGSQEAVVGGKVETSSLESPSLSRESSMETSTYVVAGLALLLLGLGIAGATGLIGFSSAEKAKEKKAAEAFSLSGRKIESLPRGKGPFQI
jgi:hypothetical protein